MWLRRAFFVWLFPAAFLLPLWLLVGWAVFQAGAWVFLWVLFIAVPSVLAGQIVLTLLVRSRSTVRTQRAVSWWDVVGFAIWHGLTIAVGFYNPVFFVPVLVGAIVVGLGMFWLSLSQLWSEARASLRSVTVRASTPSAAASPSAAKSSSDSDVIVLTETPRSNAR